MRELSLTVVATDGDRLGTIIYRGEIGLAYRKIDLGEKLVETELRPGDVNIPRSRAPSSFVDLNVGLIDHAVERATRTY